MELKIIKISFNGVEDDMNGGLKTIQRLTFIIIRLSYEDY